MAIHILMRFILSRLKSQRTECHIHLPIVFLHHTSSLNNCPNQGHTTAQNNVTIRRCLYFNISHPSNNMIKGQSVGNILCQNKAISSSKTVGCETPDLFLCSCVPQLQLHRFLFNLLASYKKGEHVSIQSKTGKCKKEMYLDHLATVVYTKSSMW